MMLASGALLPELIDDDPRLERFFLTIPFGPTAADRARRARDDAGPRSISSGPAGSGTGSTPSALSRRIARARGDGADVTAELWGARSPDPLVPPSRAARPRRRARARARHRGRDRDRRLGAARRAARAPRARRRRGHARPGRHRGALRVPHASRRRARGGAPGDRDDRRARRGRGGGQRRRLHRARAAIPTRSRTSCVELADDPARLAAARARAPAVAAGWAYEKTVAPLAAWCRDPRRARAGARAQPSLRARAVLRQARAAGVQRASNSSTSAS